MISTVNFHLNFQITTTIMKAVTCAVIALACVFGLVVADYGASYVPIYGGYGGYGGGAGGFGQGGCKYLFLNTFKGVTTPLLN